MGLKLFGFIAEPVFAFIPESCRDHLGTPFGIIPESRSSCSGFPRDDDRSGSSRQTSRYCLIDTDGEAEVGEANICLLKSGDASGLQKNGSGGLSTSARTLKAIETSRTCERLVFFRLSKVLANPLRPM
jgi:hypothetical protein